MLTLFIMLLVKPLATDAAPIAAPPATTPSPSMICKELDYNSYFRSQTGQDNIKKINPVLAKTPVSPNFAQKYLLLKNEMMFETIWLIADCQTGKFYHESIKGELTFDLTSPKVVSVTKDSTQSSTQYFTWVNDEWMKNDAPPTNDTISTSTNTTMSAMTLIAKYEAEFSNYPIPPNEMLKTCKELDYRTSHRVQNNKKEIVKLNPDLAHPNFAGKYLILKHELLFETLWLMADCETGKFVDTKLTGKANFRPNSALVLLTDSGDFPKLLLWRENQWVRLKDPVQNNKQKFTNALTDADSKLMFENLPNPDKIKIIRFETLICNGTPSAPECTVELRTGKPLAIPQASARIIFALIQKWGASLKLSSGRCSQKDLTTQCEVEISTP